MGRDVGKMAKEGVRGGRGDSEELGIKTKIILHVYFTLQILLCTDCTF